MQENAGVVYGPILEQQPLTRFNSVLLFSRLVC